MQFIKGLGSLAKDVYFILKETGRLWQILSRGIVTPVHRSDDQ